MNLDAQILFKNALDCISQSNLEAAEALLNKALLANPNNDEILRLLSVVAALRLDHSKAIELIDQAILVAPDNGIAHSNRGNVLQALGRYEDAISSFDQAISLLPDYAEAYNNKGNALQDLKRFDEALAWYDKAIAIEPNYVEAYCNKGNALEWLRRHNEAMENFDKATSINPQYTDAYWQKAMNQLAGGNFELGWRNYEARWVKSNPVIFQYSDIARLENTENLNGKKVLVWAEQGLGDTLQFCRYVKLLWVKGAQVTLIVPQALIRVLDSLQEFCRVIPMGQNLDERFEFQTPLMSLPLLFSTNIDSIPAEVPYLFPPRVISKSIQDLVKPSSNLKVGIVWSGGFRAIHSDGHADFHRRNVELEQIADLKEIQGIDFYSLQKGDPAESELIAKKNELWPSLINCAHLIHDFSDTAALIESMDLIISVDTSTAHLAGALGKSVWILNRYDSCWRWLLGQEQSPWYPTAKIYQQKNIANWAEVIERVKADLSDLAQKYSKTR
ncbi:tetratricopeptide repeat protein [Polynucleobacter necessarius]|uniref:tetratricopeptide repeat-containing glycosyltransferase family protein n=1 Tax=Polynucleobacter necessarius TaxID=576610 RepID=UPI000E094448|nr:tetratricopeptide repeat-containing glycosyltransferase family protein [Polynucleobacter necessarius]